MNPDENQNPAPAQPESPITPEPTPMAAPAPAAPAEPVQTQPGSEPTPQPQSPFAQQPDEAKTPAPAAAPQGNGSKKKLIILLSAVIGGILVLGGIAAAVYLMFFTVTKDDYQQAFDQLEVVRESTNDAVISGAATEEQIEGIKAAYETFKQENAKLADLKALRVDPELNEKYEAYDAKAKEFIAFMDDVLPSLEKLSAASNAIDSDSSSGLTSQTLEEGIAALEAAGDVSDPSIKAFVDKAIASYKKILPHLQTYETSTDSSARLAALMAINSETIALSGAAVDMGEDIQKRYEEVSPKDAFNELGSLAAKKLNEQK